MRAIHQRIIEILTGVDEPMSTSQITNELGDSSNMQLVGRHLRAMIDLELVERVEAKPGGGTTWALASDDDTETDEGGE